MYINLTFSVITIIAKYIRQSILAVLARGEEVEVKGIGTFRTINSNQGEIQRVAYTPDEQMKELVNAPFNFFEPVTINQK